MTRNLSQGPVTDGSIVTRPGRRALHMPRIGLVDPKAPLQTPNAARVAKDPDVGQIVGDLTKAIATLVPKVLQTKLYKLDANGQASEDYHAPYQCLSIVSESASTLTVTSSPNIGTAPLLGAGVARIPGESFVVANMAGYAWTIYGGAAGELVTVTAYALPQPPAAAKLANQQPGPLSTNNMGSVTNPAGGAVITSIGGAFLNAIAPNGGRWRIDWQIGLQGTIAAADANNMRLTTPLNTTLALGVIEPVVITRAQEPVETLIPAGQGINVQAIGAASGAAAVYVAQIVAELMLA